MRRAPPVVVLLALMVLQIARGLPCVARYAVIHPPSADAAARAFDLVISSGSVVDFAYGESSQLKGNKAAIVNAANELCLGGGGVDGAISTAGGPNLLADRTALPEKGGVRCPTGGAVITGPGSYGTLRVSYVIHAVGPNYMSFGSNLVEGDKLLRSAYSQSLERAKEAGLEAVAFSLISSGIFRGQRSKKEVLRIGMEAIADFDGYDELEEVHMCAYSAADSDTLCEIAAELGLPEIGKSQ